MKIILSAAVLLFAMSTASVASVGAISGTAAGVLESVAILQHEWLHDEYGSSFGSHGLEEAATDLYAGLLDWEAGGLTTEADLFGFKVVLDNAYLSYTQSIALAGVLGQGDATADLYDKVIGNMFLRLSFSLNNLDPFGT